MIVRRFSLTVLAALIICAGTVRADVITSFQNTVATGGDYTTLSGPPTVGANTFTTNPTDPNTVNITAEMSANPSIGEWTVTVADSGQTNDYDFTVNLTNETGGAMGPVTVELLAGSLSVGTGSSIRFHPSPSPTSTWHIPPTVTSPADITNSQIFFGSGGGTLADGDSGTLTFRLRIANNAVSSGTGTFRFRLTATPEPTSLIFGAIGLCVAGGLGMYARRRRKAPASSDPRLQPGDRDSGEGPDDAS
jgi:hypothetical protein